MGDYIDLSSGNQSRYAEYITLRGNKGFEVEHVWPNHPENFREEFAHKSDFEDYGTCRRMIARLMSDISRTRMPVIAAPESQAGH